MNHPETSLGADGESSSKLEFDRVLDVFSHRYRRQILLAIDADNPSDRNTLTPAELDVGTDDPERFETELYHRHLPKLDDAGYIDWDREANAVRRGANYEEIAPLVRLLQNHGAELPSGWL